MTVDILPAVGTRKAQFMRTGSDNFAVFEVLFDRPIDVVPVERLTNLGKIACGCKTWTRELAKRVKEDVVDVYAELVYNELDTQTLSGRFFSLRFTRAYRDKSKDCETAQARKGAVEDRHWCSWVLGQSAKEDRTGHLDKENVVILLRGCFQ